MAIALVDSLMNIFSLVAEKNLCPSNITIGKKVRYTTRELQIAID